MTRILAALAALPVLFMLSAPVRADSLVFTIFKEDEAIGHDAYTITKDNDLTTVKVETKTDAKVLFMEFHYLQNRTEVWKDGKLRSLVSDTNDDGTKHHVEVKREDGALVGIADGHAKSLPGETMPFSLWNNDLLSQRKLFDAADFELLKIDVEDKGTDSITAGGKSIAAHHYLVTGDLKWDLWFGPDRTLYKTAFRRSGYPITFVRE